MDDLVIPEHAQEAMQDNGMSEDDVFVVLGDYDEWIERDEDGRAEYSRMMEDGRYLVVVIENDGLTMVTGWCDARRSRRRDRRGQPWS